MKTTEFEDLNYQCGLEELYPGELGLKIDKTSLRSIILIICKLFYYSLKSLNPFVKKLNFPRGIDTLVVISSLNQYRALDKLIQSIPNTLVLSTFPVDNCNNIIIDTRGNCWASVFNLPKLLKLLFSKKGFQYKSILYHFYDYLNTPGVYIRAFDYIKEIKPKSLLIANDHTFITRSYFRASQQLGVKTIYTQHASVSNLFPALEFDYAFLDGEETLNKYRHNGRPIMTDVFLSGSPRFDKIPLIPEVNIYDLGLAINMLDNKDKVLSFVKKLSENKINFIVRPHPGQVDIMFWEKYCKQNNIAYSNPHIDNPISFIASCNRFAVGDSALHLEVALCKKISYYVNFQNNEPSDCYDYLKEGLVKIKSEKDIVDILTGRINDEISIDKVKYYVANFESEYWGKSTKLIFETIKQINTNEKISLWESRMKEERIFEIKS
ncbi:MAG: hypothetical protein DI539_12710 [Flavobacterium psychrophilum]|nr:MAG: hypothetical protein DI539_12710 [Flavobacterium psychrophilum]